MLGDCWFLTALAALSEWPERVKKIWSHKSNSLSTSGIYEATFWGQGKSWKVSVDDRIPYLS